MTVYVSDPYRAGPRLPVDAYVNYAKRAGAQGPYEAFIREVVRVCPLLPNPLDDAIICGQADDECSTWQSSYWINDGNAMGIGIYAAGVPSPFNVSGNGALAARIAIANLWIILGYGRNLPSIISDVNNVSGLSTYLDSVQAAASYAGRPRVYRIQDMGLFYTGPWGEQECTFACNSEYPNDIVARLNAAVSIPNTQPIQVAAPSTPTTLPGYTPATGSTTVQVSSGPDIGREVVALARQQLGKPYVWATHGPDTFDCSGLTAWLYAQVTGKWFTTGSQEQWDSVGWGVSRSALSPGDLLFFDSEGDGGAGHVGVWTGDSNISTQMVNALNPGAGVVYSNPFDAYFSSIFLGAKRVYNPPATTSKKLNYIGFFITNQSLNVRDAPSPSGNLIKVVPKGVEGNILGQPQNGYTPIAIYGVQGWGATTSLSALSAPASGQTTTTSGGQPAPPSSPKPPAAVKTPLTTWQVYHLVFPNTNVGTAYVMPQAEQNQASNLLNAFPQQVAILSGNRCKVVQRWFRGDATTPITTATTLPDGTHYPGPDDVLTWLNYINAQQYDHVFVYYPREGITSSKDFVTTTGAGGGYTAVQVTADGWNSTERLNQVVRQFMAEVDYVFNARNACRVPDLLNPTKYSSKVGNSYTDATNGLKNFLADTMTGQLVEKSSGQAVGISNAAWLTGPPITTNTAVLPQRPGDMPPDTVTFPRLLDESILQPGDVMQITDRQGTPFSLTPGGDLLGYLPPGARAVVLTLPQSADTDGTLWTNVATRYGTGWAPLGYEDVTTAYPDWCLNPTIDDDLHGVYANEPTMDLQRAFVGESFTALAGTWGMRQFEGIRFESGTGLHLLDGPVIVGMVDLCGVGTIDTIVTRLWSHQGPAVNGEALTGFEDQAYGQTVTLQPDAWQRIVVPAIAQDPQIPLLKVEYHIVNSTPQKMIYHARSCHLVQL